jgi:hypothetical protein
VHRLRVCTMHETIAAIVVTSVTVAHISFTESVCLITITVTSFHYLDSISTTQCITLPYTI